MDDLQALAGTSGGAQALAPQMAPGAGQSPNGALPTGYADDPLRVHDAIASAPADQQAIVLQRLRLIDRIAQAIASQTRDPVERARMAQHIAQMHPEMGIDPGVLTPQSMSDPNIAALHELAGEATLRVALASLGARSAAGGAGAGSAGPPGEAVPLHTAPTPARRPTGPSHAAQGFTILGVE